MTILDIIEKKRDKKELSKEEIEFFVNGYTKGEITDYQAAALVMAIFIQGMTDKETANLTIAMANSGEVLDLSKLNKIIGKFKCELLCYMDDLEAGIENDTEQLLNLFNASSFGYGYNFL